MGISGGALRLIFAAAAAWAALGGGCSSVEKSIGAEHVAVASEATPAVAPDVPWRPRGKGVESNDYAVSCPRIKACEREQEEAVWCWAACAQMIHRYYGHEVSQQELADRIHGHNEGGTVNVEAASYHEVMAALNPELPKNELENLRAQSLAAAKRIEKGQRSANVSVDYMSYARSKVDEMLPVNSDVIVEELGRGAPVVVVLSQGEDATLEHAYVLWGAGFAVESSFVAGHGLDRSMEGWVVDPIGKYARKYSLRWVDVIDPYDGQSVRLTGGDLRDRVKFMISKERSKQILQNEMKLVGIR